MLLLLNWEAIMSLISLLFGSSTVITYILYSKQQKRLRNAEAFAKEVEALKNTISAMQQQMQYYENRLIEMQKFVIGRESYTTQVSRDKHMLEIKNAKNETTINAAYGCSCRTESHKCPVLMKRSTNEEEFLKILNFNNQKEKNN